MGDLKIFNLPLGNVTLEKMDIANDQHMKVMQTMRDSKAVEMCYDVMTDINAVKRGNLEGNHFLVKDDKQYFGYMYISDDYDGERILAYIVEQKVRGKGFGKIMLSSVSDYLFDLCNTDVIKLYINKRNLVGIRLAMSCGFEKTNVSDDILCGYDRKK